MGCKECPYSPKTYEEFCIVENRAKHGEHDKLIDSGLCPDAFTHISPVCGNYYKYCESIDNELTIKAEFAERLHLPSPDYMP